MILLWLLRSRVEKEWSSSLSFTAPIDLKLSLVFVAFFFRQCPVNKCRQFSFFTPFLLSSLPPTETPYDHLENPVYIIISRRFVSHGKEVIRCVKRKSRENLRGRRIKKGEKNLN